MPDTFTDTSTQGFFSRIGSSLAGLLIGPLLIIAAVVLLSWNEGRSVKAIRGLADAATKVVEVQGTSVAGDDDGKLVHVVGAATASAAIQDPDVGVSFPGEVAVRRSVEMYQWVEHKKSSSHTSLGGSKKTTTTYTYTKEWHAISEDSSQFEHPDGHTNPPMPFQNHSFDAADAKLGGYALDATTLGLIDPPQTLTPQAPSGWTASGGKLYKGDPNSPSVGEVRVVWQGLPTGATLSVLAAQSHDGFAPFTTSNGYQVQLAETGNRPAQVMLADKGSEESHLTWILRGVGLVAIFIGFRMFFGVLSTLASVIPFLGRLIGGAVSLLSLALAVPLTLLVIALAWLAVRPLLGGSLLALAIIALVGLIRWHYVHKRARMARVAAMSTPVPPPLPSRQ